MGINQGFFGGREGHPGLGMYLEVFDEDPARAATGFVRLYAHTNGWFEKRGATIRKFALQEQANIFTLLNRFKDLQLDDQDGTPIADRVLRTIDGLIRATSTGLVEGRYISKASIELLDTANLNDDSVTFAKIQNVTGPCLIGKSGSGSGDAAEISAAADDTVARRTGGAVGFGGLTTGMASANLWPFSKLQQVAGPVVVGKTGSGAGDMAEISASADDRVLRRTGGVLDFGQLTLGMAAANLWTYAKIQQVSATNRFLGRKTAGAGDIEELTGTEATSKLDAFTGDSGSGGVKGLVPAPGAGDAAAGRFLKSDGNWATPSGGAWTEVWKASDESITSDATLNDDSDLKFTMAASTKYAFELVVWYDTPAAADFKWRHTGPAAPNFVQIAREHIVPGGAAYVVRNDEAYSGGDVQMLNSSGTQGYIRMRGLIHNGVTSGDFKFQWSQDTSDAGTTKVRAGSYLRWRAV